MSESRQFKIPSLGLVCLPEFFHVFDDVCIEGIQVICPPSLPTYRLLVITAVAFTIQSLADCFLAPAGTIPPQWGYGS